VFWCLRLQSWPPGWRWLVWTIWPLWPRPPRQLATRVATIMTNWLTMTDDGSTMNMKLTMRCHSIFHTRKWRQCVHQHQHHQRKRKWPTNPSHPATSTVAYTPPFPPPSPSVNGSHLHHHPYPQRGRQHDGDNSHYPQRRRPAPARRWRPSHNDDGEVHSQPVLPCCFDGDNDGHTMAA